MLTLEHMSLEGEVASLRYELRHNVAALSTTIDFPLHLKVNTRTGEVLEGSLVVNELKAPDLDTAIGKLATWLERLGAAARAVKRQEGAGFPVFEHTGFDFNALTSWQRVLYEQMLNDLRGIPTDEFSSYFRRLRAENHPLVLISDALDIARTTVMHERGE
jgi:hypothetical protein